MSTFYKLLNYHSTHIQNNNYLTYYINRYNIDSNNHIFFYENNPFLKKTKIELIGEVYNNIFVSNEVKQIFMEIIYNAQKKYFALLNLKNRIRLRYIKKYDIKYDLSFVPFEEINPLFLMNLIINNRLYTFNLSDLIKIINNSLTFNYNFFSDAKPIKNPYDNSLLSYANIFNIYWKIKNSSISMPLLLERFYKSNFELNSFVDNNEYLIREYLISKWSNLDHVKKTYHIKKMIYFYNTLVPKSMKITIDKKFPCSKLLKTFELYLPFYFNATLSLENKIKHNKTKELKIKLKEFKKKNPLFGRRIFSRHIRSIYKLSSLKYVHGFNSIGLFTGSSFTIPPIDCILLEERSFVIDENMKDVNIGNLNTYAINYKYNENELSILNREVIPLIKEVFASENTTETNSETNDTINDEETIVSISNNFFRSRVNLDRFRRLSYENGTYDHSNDNENELYANVINNLLYTDNDTDIDQMMSSDHDTINSDRDLLNDSDTETE